MKIYFSAFHPQSTPQQTPLNENEFASQVNGIIHELIQQADDSPQIHEVKTKCQEFITDFYNQLKSQHMKTVKCKDIISKKSNAERKNEILNQLKIVLNNFSRQIGVPVAK